MATTSLCKRDFAFEVLQHPDQTHHSAPKHVYKNWEIATVVHLVRKVEGSVTRVEIDLKCMCNSTCICPTINSYPFSLS